MSSKIISKIRALFALASNNTASGEIAAALAKAQQLMNDYNISEDMLEDVARPSLQNCGKSLGEWHSIILPPIAKLFGVTVIFDTDENYFFVGRPVNLELAEIAEAFVLDQILELGKSFGLKELSANEASDFMHGVVYSIIMKCADIEAALPQNTKERNALIVIAQNILLQENNEFLRQNMSAKLREVAIPKIFNENLFEAGTVAGKTININQSVKKV